MEHVLDLADDFRRGLVQRCQPPGDLGAQILRQPRQDGGGLRGLQVGDDQRDSLWVLVLDECGDLRGVRFLQEVERHHLERLHDAAHDQGGFFLAESAHQHLAGSIHAALGDELLRDAQLMELLDHGFAQVRVDAPHAGDLDAEAFDLVLRHVLEDLAGGLGTERDQQDRGLLAIGEGLRT